MRADRRYSGSGWVNRALNTVNPAEETYFFPKKPEGVPVDQTLNLIEVSESVN